jgi:DNA-binding GntR family transcriptional regulator
MSIEQRHNPVMRPRKADKEQQRPQSLADRAFEEIEEMIVGGTLAPGTLISESELGQHLKMGRTPIREALARLKFLGFVDVHPRRGISVSGVDVIRHLQVLEVRLPLEQAIAIHAIDRATESDIAELKAVARRIVQAGNGGDRLNYFRVKRDLHRAQVDAAHNEVLAGTMRVLHAQARRFWWTYEPTESFPQAAKLHRAISDHVIARDKKKAVRAVHDLFEHLEGLTRQVIERRQRF